MSSPTMSSYSDQDKPIHILHLSADYPNPYRNITTNAVQRLIEAVPHYQHSVISLKRQSNPVHARFRVCDDEHYSDEAHPVHLIAYNYFAPPMGIGLAMAMRRVARRVEAYIQEKGLKPDIIHAHKYTFEGIAALQLSQRLGIPFVISVRGEAEVKIFRYKPTYLPLMQKIAQEADKIYFVSAWFEAPMSKKIQLEKSKISTLPNIIHFDHAATKPCDAEPAFVTVLDLNVYQKKGLHDLLHAFAKAQKSIAPARLEIIGSGSKEAVAEVTQLIKKLKLDGKVLFLGKMNNDVLTQNLRRYIGLVLPSYNETFGMVYVEALFAGIPILYSKNTGIDGYLEDLDVGIAVRPGRVKQIKNALIDLNEKRDIYRQRIKNNQDKIHAIFDGDKIAARYAEDIRNIIEAHRSG